MTLGPVRVMGAGVVVMLCVEEVRYHFYADQNTLGVKNIVVFYYALGKTT